MKKKTFLILAGIIMAFPAMASGAEKNTEDNPPAVYFTSDITSDSLIRIYEALGWAPEGKTGVKISTGEPPASNYLRPELIGDLVGLLDANIVECMTAYGGARSSVAMHKQVAEDTHAGQIWPVGPLTELGGDLNYGLYHKEEIDVIVSSGIAGWGYPIRTGKHCEYVVVHIIPE